MVDGGWIQPPSRRMEIGRSVESSGRARARRRAASVARGRKSRDRFQIAAAFVPFFGSSLPEEQQGEKTQQIAPRPEAAEKSPIR